MERRIRVLDRSEAQNARARVIPLSRTRRHLYSRRVPAGTMKAKIAGRTIWQESGIRPYVEDAAVAKLLRKERAAEILAEYEREHGVITRDELDALEREWPA